jgi:CRISPR-associated protein Cas1
MSEVVPDLIPVRMLNEYVYCPRLAYLEWSDQQWASNADTAEGSATHRRVDRARGVPPDPQAMVDRPASTAVEIGSSRYGLVGRIDLLETDGAAVVPIEYKTGSPRDGPHVLWDPERVQLCAQVLALRDAGYEVPHAAVWFAGTRTRHDIIIDDELIELTLSSIAGMRECMAASTPPAPLIDSPKCPRCSLVGLCLPDEINLLSVRGTDKPRRLIAGADPAQPLYATTPGSRVTRRGGRVVLLEKGEEVASRRLLDVSHIAVFGNVDVGSALLRDCFDAGIAVLWFTAGGWFCGVAQGMPKGNVTLRMRQHRAAMTGDLSIVRQFVIGKIKNQRTLLRRHGGPDAAASVDQLAGLVARAREVRALESLLGIEGTAARLYFEQFSSLLRPATPLGPGPTFDGRNRRPPRDPVNAVLSFVYSLLIKDCTVALLAAGLDPFVGLYHQPRFGRPSLALDLAEEVRPLVGDSVVMTLFNNGELAAGDFVTRAGGVSLTRAGRRSVIRAYERRMRTELTHPLFKYKASYRRTLEIQARLLAAALTRDSPEYRPLTTR